MRSYVCPSEDVHPLGMTSPTCTRVLLLQTFFFGVINMLSAVCVSDVDDVVAAEYPVFDCDEFCGRDCGKKDDGV